MPLPAKTTFVTFDVYGTLIDWESGIWDAFAAEAARDGFTIEREEVIPLFHEISRQIEKARLREARRDFAVTDLG